MPNLPVLRKIQEAISVRRTVKGVRARSAQLREELAEAESVEQLVESLFMVIDELLEEVEKAGLSVQRATTKMRNLAKERKAQLHEMLSDDGS